MERFNLDIPKTQFRSRKYCPRIELLDGWITFHYLDEVDTLDDVDTEDEVDTELEVETLK